MPRRQDLNSKLAEARQQLQKAQSRVADLEAQLFEDQPNFVGLAGSDDQYRRTLDNLLEGCQIIGFDWRYLYINDTAVRHGQRTKDELIGYSMMERYPGIEKTPMFAVLKRCMQERSVERMENEFTYPDGASAWFELTIQPVPEGIFILSLDITERKRAEEALQRSEIHFRSVHRTLGVLSDINQSIVRIRHLPTLFEKACEIAVEKGAFRIAWIGLFDPETRSVHPVAHGGISDNELEKLVLTSNAHPLIDPLRAGERLIFNDIQNDPMWLMWHEDASRLGCHSTVILPLIVAGEIRGIFNLHAGETNFFDEQEMRLMDEMAMDISYSIEVAEQEERRQQAEAAVEDYTQRLEILHQIDRDIINANSTEEIVETALKHIRQLIPCQRANVGLIDMANGEGIIFAVDYNGNTALGKGLRVPLQPDFFDGYDERHLKVIPDLRTLQDVNPRFKQGVSEGLLSGLNVLLMDRGHPIGTLGLFANAIDFFTLEHQEIIIEMGSQLAVAIRQMQLSKQIAQHTATLEQQVAKRTADLSAAKERVEAILNNSPDAILLADSDLTIRQTNSSFNTLFGLERDAYFSKSLLTLLHPGDVRSASDLLQIAAHQQNGRRIEVRAIRMDGTTFDAELSIGIIKGDGLVCIIRDITEQKAQERQLRYHASLQESVSDAVLVMDMEFTLQSWNKAAELIYGWAAEEAIGTHANTILRNQLSEEENHRLFAQLMAQSWLKFDLIQHHKEGNPLNIWCSMTLIKDVDGHPVGILSVNHDITERKQAEEVLRQSEERFASAFRFSPVAIGLTSAAEGRYLDVNDSLMKLLGYSREEMIGRTASELNVWITPEEREAAVQMIREKGSVQGLEVGFRQKTGEICTTLTSIVPVMLNGQPCLLSIVHDISERKQAEEALQRSAAEIHDLYNNAPCGYHSIDKNGLIVQINDMELHWLGYTREEVVSKIKITDIFTPESVAVFRKEFPAFVERGWVNDLEFDVVRKDGSLMHILLSATAIYDDAGQYLKSRSTLFDITALQQAQQAVAESEARYRLLAENIADVIMTFSLDRVITYMSPSCERLLGYLPQEVEGKSHSEFIHPEDYPEVLDRTRRAVISKENYYTNQFRLRHKTGRYIWYEVRTRIVFDQDTGSVVQFVSVLRDITERRQSEEALRESEEKYRSLVETMRGGLAVFDTEFRINYVNDRFCELLGYSREEVIGRRPVNFVDAVHIPVVQWHLQRRQNNESTSYEIPLRHKDGHQIHVLISGSPLLNKQGKYNGSIVVATDISIQKQAEDTLRQALVKEKELGDLKTRFVSMASHEFRTPLATILALVETLSAYRHKLPEEQIEQRFDKIKDQVGHLKDIMEDVLMLARMQARRVDFNPVKMDLDALARSVLDEFESRPDVKHRLEYSVGKGNPEVMLDRKLMRQIISNLVSNAIKYSPEDKVVRIHLKYTDSDVILKISDNGIGIPEADLPHLFEPFHRAANVGTISGTGLGLVITKEAVELHGGTIVVESLLGEGTTFIIRIPISAGGKRNHDENPAD